MHRKLEWYFHANYTTSVIVNTKQWKTKTAKKYMYYNKKMIKKGKKDKSQSGSLQFYANDRIMILCCCYSI